MQGQNPYAPPQTVAQGAYRVPGATFDAWIDGQELVVPKAAPLPDVCVKCGLEGTLRRPHQFVFTPQWVIFIFLFSPLIGAVVALVVQKKGKLDLPLCAPCQAAWKGGILLLVLAVLWMIVGLILGIMAFANELPAVGAPLVLSAFAVLITVAIVNRNRFLRSKKVDEQSIWLMAVHPRAVEAILAAAHGAP